MSDGVLWTSLKLIGSLALVFANIFFVCAEFSMVVVRRSRVEQMARDR